VTGFPVVIPNVGPNRHPIKLISAVKWPELEAGYLSPSGAVPPPLVLLEGIKLSMWT
jgi:hypothetical protein